LPVAHDGHEHAHSHDPVLDHDHAHTHEPSRDRSHSLLSIMVPFGAAGAAIGSVVVFGAVTIATIVGLTLFAAAGGYRVRGQWLERWGNMLTASVLIVIGALVLTGVI
jgi:hypothetical protein